jgi:hypothetical protein
MDSTCPGAPPGHFLVGFTMAAARRQSAPIGRFMIRSRTRVVKQHPEETGDVKRNGPPVMGGRPA